MSEVHSCNIPENAKVGGWFSALTKAMQAAYITNATGRHTRLTRIPCHS